MSVWQFNAALAGYAKQFDDSGMSDTEKDEMWDWLQAQDDVPLQLSGKKGANGDGRRHRQAQSAVQKAKPTNAHRR